LDTLTLDAIRARWFAAGSMGPKVAAAARFVEATGRTAAIGSLADVAAIVGRRAGTRVVTGGQR
jgi:carbamate kinase